MASQAYTFPLLSAFVGTMASSQHSQRSTYTANLTLTLKPERQLAHSGFLSKGADDVEFVLLMHTGPQQLVRLYLAEFVQTSGHPMPYEMEHRESRNAIRLRYEPSPGERCQVGAEFTKRSDFMQAAQLFERLGMRFRPVDSVQRPSRGLDSRPVLGSPQPPIISPTTSSLSNRRPGSAFSSSQRSWSPMQWGSTSSPSSQPAMSTGEWPSQSFRPAMVSSASKSASPGPGQAQSLHNQLLQSNLFISQAVSRTSEPPQSWHSHSSASASLGRANTHLFVDRAPVYGEDLAAGHRSRGLLSLQASEDTLQIRPPSVLSDRMSQERLELDDYTSLMPPPRQLPFAASKKPQAVLQAEKTDIAATTTRKPPGASKSTTRPLPQPAETPDSHDTSSSSGKAPRHAPVAPETHHLDSATAAASKAAPKKSRPSPIPSKSGQSKRQRKDKETGAAREPSNVTAPQRTRSGGRGIAASSSRDAGAQVNFTELPLQTPARSSGHINKHSQQSKTACTTPLGTKTPPGPPRRLGLRSGKQYDETPRAAAMETPSVGPEQPMKQFQHAKTQTKVSTKNRGSTCDIRPPQASSGTQTGAVMVSTGTSSDAVPASHQATQTDAMFRQADDLTRGEYVDNSVQTQAASTLNAASGCNIRPFQGTSATQTERQSVETGIQAELDSTPSNGGAYLSSDMVVAAFRLISDARDLMHRHVDGDLDKMEKGLHVDIANSMGEMFHEVEDLAQSALNEHGPAILEMPFSLMARDYLRGRETRSDAHVN